MGRVFSIAPMSSIIRAFTLALLGLPVVFLVLYFMHADAWPLLPTAGFLALVYASVWFFGRPSQFEVDPTALTIRWPVRSRRIARGEIRGASIVTGRDLRGKLGFTVRIGAGGLFGVFGWLWTPRRGLVDIYTSRADRMVAVERTNGRLMLLSPGDPEAFVSALSESSVG